MTTWRDRTLEAGAFRGVPFLYEKVEGQIGRRTVLKEFPGRDQPQVEDLGLATRKFTIDMFVLGPDYDADRDALRGALETAGPGQLDHPYWGSMQVTVVGEVRVTETTKKGGMAVFAVTFVEAGAQLALVQANTASEVVAAADVVEVVAVDEFAAAFSVVGAISSVIDAVVGTLDAVASALNSVRGKIAAAMQVIDDVKHDIDEITATAVDLINTPQILANKIMSVVSSVSNAITSITQAFSDLKDFFGGEDALPSVGSALAKATRVTSLGKSVDEMKAMTDTKTAEFALLTSETHQRAIEASAQKALLQLTKAANAVAMSRAIADLQFESVDQAVGIRKSITAVLDDLMGQDDLSDTLYAPLADLRAKLVEHLNKAANSLPELQDYVPATALPALVIAYQVYGDSKREAEILARNPQVRDPSTISGGVAIKVLVDA